MKKQFLPVVTPYTMVFSLVFFLSTQGAAQTFVTAQNGSWTSATTWVGGVAPASGGNLTSGQTVIINHNVTYNIASDLNIFGSLSVIGTLHAFDTLSFPSGRNVTVKSGGNYIIICGSHYQRMFTAGGAPASGSFKNEGGTVEFDYAYVEIPQDWTSTSGTRIFKNGCLFTGQNYSNDNTLDSMINVRISVGAHGSGSFEGKTNSTRIHFVQCKISISGVSGNFQLDDGVYSGTIDSISVKAVGGKIKSTSSTAGNISLAWYCVSSAPMLEDLKPIFTGTKTRSPIYPVTLVSVCPISVMVPVPVVLGNFTVMRKNERDAQLNWTSYTETAFSHYSIERSSDAINFNEIGIILTSGQEESASHYSYTDKALANAVYYYRLKMTDRDGGYKYSQVKTIRISDNKQEELKLIVFPNPVQNELKISLPLEWQGEKLRIELYNAQGQVVNNILVNSASQTESVTVKDLAPGFYIIKAITFRGSATQRIIKK